MCPTTLAGRAAVVDRVGVTTLDHKFLHDTVERGIVIETSLRELQEVLLVLWRFIVEFHVDIAKICSDFDIGTFGSTFAATEPDYG